VGAEEKVQHSAGSTISPGQLIGYEVILTRAWREPDHCGPANEALEQLLKTMSRSC